MRLRHFVLIAGTATLGIAACVDLASSPAARPRATAISADVAATPTLAICPNANVQQSATTVVGLLGGTVALGGTSITIPAGAVLQPTAFQIVIPQSQYMEVDFQAVGLTTFLFQQPATVTIDYSRCPAGAIPAGAVPRAVYVDDNGSILQDMGGVADTVAHSVTFSTGHLSGYAVAY